MRIGVQASVAVVIVFVSALTFVGLYRKARAVTAQWEMVAYPAPSSSGAIQYPSPEATTGAANVVTSVEIGGDGVRTSVTIE